MSLKPKVPYKQVPYKQVPYKQIPYKQVPYKQVPYKRTFLYISCLPSSVLYGLVGAGAERHERCSDRPGERRLHPWSADPTPLFQLFTQGTQGRNTSTGNVLNGQFPNCQSSSFITVHCQF